MTDGRTHFTGRDDVHATTKPLTGLFDNEPHFTRALDEDMAMMIMAEFRVASANTDHGPMFSIDDTRGAPALPSGADALLADSLRGVDTSALGLRKALMTFLRDFVPPKNPRAVGRSHMRALERRGAELFRDDCASCHSPRLVANDARSEVPFDGWEAEIFGAGRIVWARDGREKTGILPYVHLEGARPTSLRRLARKRPYFTNGSSDTLADVLHRIWVDPDGVVHARLDDAPGRPLATDDVKALEAFLELL